MYKCTSYFEKLKITSYYLDDIALYCYKEIIRSFGDQKVSWEEYVKAICLQVWRIGGSFRRVDRFEANWRVGNVYLGFRYIME